MTAVIDRLGGEPAVRALVERALEVGVRRFTMVVSYENAAVLRDNVQ